MTEGDRNVDAGGTATVEGDRVIFPARRRFRLAAPSVVIVAGEAAPVPAVPLAYIGRRHTRVRA
jgi:hypothetical protein